MLKIKKIEDHKDKRYIRVETNNSGRPIFVYKKGRFDSIDKLKAEIAKSIEKDEKRKKVKEEKHKKLKEGLNG